MSEPLAGLPAAPPPSQPKDASVVVLFRRGPKGLELFWLRRERTLRFAAGFYAYPGGRVDDADARVPVEGATGVEAARLAAAARELFEEAGVLLAIGAEAHAPDELAAFRKAVLEQTEDFGAGLHERNLSLTAKDFTPAGRWITPAFLPGRRFDTFFFLAEVPPQAEAEVWPGELAGGWWIRPEDALAKWETGEALLHPPTRHALLVLKDFTTLAVAAKAMASPPHCQGFVAERLEFQRGVMLFPLSTLTLPPATHTTCYLLGTGDLLLVDPGASEDRELDRLVRLLGELEAEGRRAKAIVLTHHHGDHASGAARLAERTGLPIWAHAATAMRVNAPVARTLEDGEVLALDGPRPMRWKVLHTPGHAPGHVTLFDEASRAAVVGDMVAGVGTIVIDPSDGDMGEYVKQLARLKALPVGTLYPAHGPAIPDGVHKLDEYLAHRAWREEKVLAALAKAGPCTAEELVPQAYDDVQAFVWPIALRSTEAILVKLVREGRASRDGERYRVTAAS